MVTGVVAHVGLHALGSFADRLRLGEALSGEITTDVAATFAIERASRHRDRRLWATAAGVFLTSLALFALALEEIPTAVAEALFVALGTGAVAAIAAHRGESITTRKGMALGLLVLGVVVLQMGALDA
jgi:multidrug transporter EmrE-like cation transporter